MYVVIILLVFKVLCDLDVAIAIASSTINVITVLSTKIQSNVFIKIIFIVDQD